MFVDIPFVDQKSLMLERVYVQLLSLQGHGLSTWLLLVNIPLMLLKI